MDETLYDFEKALDYAFFENKFVMNSVLYMKCKNFRRSDAQDLLRSPTIKGMTETINDLDLYLRGGQDDEAIYVRQAYGYLSKPDARKIRNYLDSIVEGIRKYIKDKNAKKSLAGRKRTKVVT